MKHFLTGFLIAAAVLGGPVQADTLGQPEGEIVLTLSGAIDVHNSGETAQMDRAMLRALPSTTYTTSTIWTEGTKTFVGVSLLTLLDTVEATGTTVRATAINDYAVDIPVDTITKDSPMVAYEMDGAEMSRRQKGPLWVIYPYDSDPTFRSEVVYSRSIWQLDRLDIVE